MDYEKLTKEQRTAIFAEGQILVSAAAGSGKTMVLVERVINLLTRDKDPVPADRLLIVTFTNAAAAEMFSRIEERLSAECEKHPENRALAKQRLLIESAKICTIDVFCLDLIRENFQAAGISPTFKIMPPDTETRAKTELAKEIVTQKLSSCDPEFRLFTEIIGTDETVESIAKYIVELYDKSQSMPFPSAWLMRAVGQYAVPLYESVWYEKAVSSAKKLISAAAADVKAGLKIILSEDGFSAKCSEIFGNVSETLKNILDACENKGWNDIVHAVNTYRFEPFLRGVKCSDESKEMLKAIRERTNSAVEKVKAFFPDTYSECEKLNAKSGQAVKTLVSLTRELGAKFDEQLNDKNMVTFNKAEHLAFDLLCENREGRAVKTPFAENIIGLYDEILVDEFQDTNNLQDMLFTVLSDGGKKLFIVGDAKQSIYGFRNATPENFIQKKDSYPLYGGGETPPAKVLLNANFRSREGVCDYVNFLFEKIMSRETAAIDYGVSEKLKPLAKFPENGECDTEIHIVENGKTEEEAEYIAEYIKKTVGQKILRDKQNPETLRPVKYGDIVILLRAASVKSGIYTAALKKRGIPVSSDSEDVFKTPEIMTAVSWLKSIDNPTDDISLLSAITGPVFGLSFDEAARIKQKYKQKFFYGSVTRAAADGNLKCAEFLKTVGFFRKYASVNTVEDLLNEVYRKTMMIEIFSAMEGGPLKRDNLLFLLNFAAEYSSGDGTGLSGFLRQLENAEKNGASSGGGSGGNAVRIMSIHGSKGLQFPICIIAAVGSKFNDGDLKARLVYNDNADIAFKVIDDVTGLRRNTVARQQTVNDKTEKMLAEEMRLLYVAATRAEEKLVFVISDDGTKKSVTAAAGALSGKSAGGVLPPEIVSVGRSYSYWIKLSLLLHPDSGEFAEKFGVKPTADSGVGHIKLVLADAENVSAETDKEACGNNKNAADNSDKHEADSDTVKAEIIKRFSYEYPFEEALSRPSKLTVTDLMQKENGMKYAFSERPRVLSESKLSAAERGTATHRFLQYADFENGDIDSEIARLVDWEYLSEAEAAGINTDAVKTFYSSELMGRIRSAEFYKREQRFLLEKPMIDGDKYKNDKTVIQGSVDLIFAENGGLAVVDFKTTRFEEDEDFREHYKIQLDIYSEAMEELFKMPVKEKYIYSLYKGQAIKI